MNRDPNNQKGDGFVAACLSDRGRVRDQNEDDCYLDAENGIFVVVDGVGGQTHGEVATEIAVDAIRRRLERKGGPPQVRVREALTQANNDILQRARAARELAGMACVATIAVLEDGYVTVGHVGDSRFYRLSPDGIAKLTHDHSPVGEMEDEMQISETEAMQHARRNEVFRDIGSAPQEPGSMDFVEVVQTEMSDDAAMLMCSDGLTDMLTSLEINRLVRLHAGNPAEVAAALVDAANEAGGKDNVSVIYIEGRRFRKSADPQRSVLPASQRSQVPTVPLATVVDTATASRRPVDRRRRTSLPDHLRAVLHSRALLLVIGVVLGAALTFALVRAMELQSPAATTSRLMVGGSLPGSFKTINEALIRATPGTVIEVAPGEYREGLDLDREIAVVSTVPGGAILTAPANVADWIAVTISADRAALRGFHVVGTSANPIGIGVRVLGGGAIVDNMIFEGHIRNALMVANDGASARIALSLFVRVSGVPVIVNGGAQPILLQNTFVASGASTPAIEVAERASPTLHANAFIGFTQVVQPAARQPAILNDRNFVGGGLTP